MYLVDKYYESEFYQSNIFNFYYSDLKLGVLDIETTGLNPEKDKIIIGGLLIPISGGIRAIQFFSESPEEESLLLNEYITELNKLDVLISYNGDNFDLPFINKRCKINGICCQGFNDNHTYNNFLFHQNFDLYRILDRYSTLRKLLPNLKQKTVETFMGLWSDRTDEISGAESVELYYKYLRTKNPSIRETIMLHNMDDILQLSRLLKILGKLDLHKIMFHTGFIVSNKNKKIYIKKIEFKKNFIQVTGLNLNIDMDYIHYGFSHEINLSQEYGNFYLNIFYKKAKDSYYINIDDFPMDCSSLNRYPGYQRGCLFVKDRQEILYAETNHLIKIILKEILEEL